MLNAGALWMCQERSENAWGWGFNDAFLGGLYMILESLTESQT